MSERSREGGVEGHHEEGARRTARANPVRSCLGCGVPSPSKPQKEQARAPLPRTPLSDPLTLRDLADRPLEDGERPQDVELRGNGGLHAPRSTFDAVRLTGSFAGAHLPDLHLRQSEVVDADLANAELSRSELQDSELRGSRLTGARMIDAQLRDVTIRTCGADVLAAAGSRMHRVLFADTNLRDASFDETTLVDVRFERCDLTTASFRFAKLTRVELVDCRLDGITSWKDLRGAALPFDDLMAHASVLAEELGIRVLDGDD